MRSGVTLCKTHRQTSMLLKMMQIRFPSHPFTPVDSERDASTLCCFQDIPVAHVPRPVKQPTRSALRKSSALRAHAEPMHVVVPIFINSGEAKEDDDYEMIWSDHVAGDEVVDLVLVCFDENSCGK